MAFAMRRKAVLVCLLLAVVQRTVGQRFSIGNDLPCEEPGEDPDPNNDRDNFSCPLVDPNALQCYSRDMLCDGNEFCDGGSDEGTNLVALECSKLRSNGSATASKAAHSCNPMHAWNLHALFVLCCFVFLLYCVLPCLVFLSISWMIKVVYTCSARLCCVSKGS